MFTDSEILNEIEKLEAHANEASKIAARLKLKLRPVSTGLSKNSAKELAKAIAKKRKIQNRKNL